MRDLGVERGWSIAFSASKPGQIVALGSYTTTSSEIVIRAHERGIGVFPGVDTKVNKNPEVLEALVKKGVDGIISDDPQSLKEVVERL